MSVANCLSKILEKYGSGEYQEEVFKAKNEFDELVGLAPEGTESFDRQMRAFNDWYLFDRLLEKENQSPVQHYFNGEVDSVCLYLQERLENSIHSLFEVTKIKGSVVYLRDLVGKKKYEVKDSDLSGIFHKDDILETRLIDSGETHVFSGHFIFHSGQVKSFISKKAKEMRKMNNSACLKMLQVLAKMKIQAERYPHINMTKIYSENPVL